MYRARVAFVISVSLLYLITQQGIRFARARSNQWYQVSYRITSPHLTSPGHLESVSIAAGTLGESYINFGWFGPLLVILPLGILLGFVQRVFLRHTSGLLLSSLDVVLLPAFLGIEGQLAQYLGGLAQQIAFALLVLVPVLKFRDRNKFGDSVLAQRVLPVCAGPLARLRSGATVKHR